MDSSVYAFMGIYEVSQTFVTNYCLFLGDSGFNLQRGTFDHLVKNV